MNVAPKKNTLRCILAAVLVFTAFHTCGHEGFCAATAHQESVPGALPLSPGDLGRVISDATSSTASEHAATGCAGDDCLCLCSTPGLSADASAAHVPLVHAGDVTELCRDRGRHIPYPIDHPPRLA
jgi:hypothetical protein